MVEAEIDDVLVVTHPLAPASESHVAALLDIIGAITSVALVTTNLSEESSIRDDFEVLEISREGVGDSILVAAVRFVLNQLRMCRTIARRDEEIVLFFGATSYLLPIAFSRLLGRTVVLEPRGDVPLTLRLQWEQKVPAPIARALAGAVWVLEHAGYRLSDAIVTYTPSMAEELGLDGYQHKLYPNGARYVDTETFDVETPFEEREKVVGFLGRLDEEKGIRTLASVAKELPDDVTFRFIGDGDLRSWLERELAEEIEAGMVEITGWVDHDEVPKQLNDLRLLVLFSEPTEGLPTVIMESMACGTPVYATPVSGVPDIVREGKTGYLLTETDVDTMASRIESVLASEELTEISGRGRSEVEIEYSRAAAIDRYTTILAAITRSEAAPSNPDAQGRV
ncbi:glycosyltransferase family 4 protein [Natronomonas sp.]|uniref:glycosyltransferase family 4 protein n=1 Tax=Natronomonas sp. TaxID=2184060 RepID=UPI003974F6A2